MQLGFSDSKPTEISLFGCTWVIPSDMSITRNKNPKRINIVTKESVITSTSKVRSIIVSYDKKNQEKFLKSMNATITNIGQFNNYFNAYSLYSEKYSFLNNGLYIFYENEEAYGMAANFTEKERLAITEKCL